MYWQKFSKLDHLGRLFRKRMMMMEAVKIMIVIDGEKNYLKTKKYSHSF